ncbi:integrase, catalytic region, zinc finger, CCHC-type containing protein [Tanacetum coccineum]
MILSVIKQMSEQMINHVNNWEKANQEKNNESLTAELERYKERVKTFEQRLNIDLSTHEKMIDSQMDDMIKEKLALKKKIDSLEQNLSNQIKEKESYCKHLLSICSDSPHKVFYDDTHKQALGYQNLFYLKKAQRIKPTLYDGSVISSQHAIIPVIDDEETLILKEVSRSNMLAMKNYPMSKEKKVNTTPINYVELNRLSEDFGKRFVPQQELSAEQAFWLQTSHPNTDQFASSPVKIEALKELPKVTEVQTVFNQMEAVVQQCSVDKQCFEIHKKELFLENDRLLHQIMSQDVMICVMNSTAVFDDSVNLEMKKSESCNKCLDLEAELVKRKNMVERDDKACDNQNALEIPEYFENIDLKAQLQAKDATICKLKEHIKSMRENDKEEKVKQEIDETETINIELEHRLKSSTSASRSHPTGNKKNDRISQIPSSNMKNKVVQIVLWYLDSGCSKHMIGNRSQLINFVSKFQGTVRFINDQIAKIMGYGDYQLGNMDLCAPMRVESINRKKYILMIVDDYSRFTWVKFLRSKDEAPGAIIKSIKNIQVHLNASVRNVRTDNVTEFVNRTL